MLLLFVSASAEKKHQHKEKRYVFIYTLHPDHSFKIYPLIYADNSTQSSAFPVLSAMRKEKVVVTFRANA